MFTDALVSVDFRSSSADKQTNTRSVSLFLSFISVECNERTLVDRRTVVVGGFVRSLVRPSVARSLDVRWTGDDESLSFVRVGWMDGAGQQANPNARWLRTRSVGKRTKVVDSDTDVLLEHQPTIRFARSLARSLVRSFAGGNK